MASLGSYMNSSSSPQHLSCSNADPLAEKVLIVTADSRILVGNLAAVDNNTNLVRPPPPPRKTNADPRPTQALSNAHERVIQTPDSEDPSVEVPLGLYLVRGDNVCTIGLVDEKLDSDIDWSLVKGSAIGGIKHV
jgi:U6 snRNA-associated Sm-like protein LSm8